MIQTAFDMVLALAQKAFGPSAILRVQSGGYNFKKARVYAQVGGRLKQVAASGISLGELEALESLRKQLERKERVEA